MTLLLYTQTLGGVLFVSIRQRIFENKLLFALQSYVPGLDPAIALTNDASGLVRAIERLGPQFVQGVLFAHSEVLDQVFICWSRNVMLDGHLGWSA